MTADTPITGIVSAAATGAPLSALERDRLRLELIDRAHTLGASWAQLAAMLGYPSGKQAKKAVHGLRERVKRADLTANQGDEADE